MGAKEKPKLAMYWASSCGGCEISVLNIHEHILTVDEVFDIVFFPCIADFKIKDLKSYPDGYIDVCLFNGAIRNSENEEMAHLLRKKSKILVAYGSCAYEGCIPALSNLTTKEATFDKVYLNNPSIDNPDKVFPQQVTKVAEGELTLPFFYHTVKSLDQVVNVDYYLPGCPPAPDQVLNAVMAILEGKLPEKGTVLAPDKALCDTCPVKDSKPEKISIKEIKRPWEIKMDPEKCFLLQGVICLGPATRSGCGETCINANQPCRGCYGPTKEVVDQGAKSLSMIASILGIEDEEKMTDEKVSKLIGSIVDPAGTVYRFSLPASLLRRKRMEVK